MLEACHLYNYDTYQSIIISNYYQNQSNQSYQQNQYNYDTLSIYHYLMNYLSR
jgi:hypothetical protein